MIRHPIKLDAYGQVHNHVRNIFLEVFRSYGTPTDVYANYRHGHANLKMFFKKLFPITGITAGSSELSRLL